MIRRLVAGLGSSVLVAAGGWKSGSLTGRGAITASLVGTAVCVGTSWPGMLCVGAFFVSSSGLSKLSNTPDVAAKGSQRDAVQVLANGGAASLAALLANRDQRVALAMAAGSLSAAAADTWATEIGSSSGAIPRQIVSGKRVQPGESGGVTFPGTAASGGGALLIAVTATASARVWMGADRSKGIFSSVLLAGVAGSLVDSLAGELIQERRYCEACDVVTERSVHRCGNSTIHIAGVRGVTNDTVNGMCTGSGALVAYGLYRWWAASPD